MAKLVPGENDLATLFPEVAKQADGWDPKTVSAGSGQKLAWKCEKGHTWEAVVGSRTPPQSNGCPFCANKKAWPGFNDLKTLCPEVAAEADGWDPKTVTVNSKAKVGWRCSSGHNWKARVQERTKPDKGTGCPVCVGKTVLAGFNDLETLFPEVAKEADGWDPKTVTAKSSGKNHNWRCKAGHAFEARVADRTPPKNYGCPYCSGRRAWPGFNDLKVLYPELAKEASGWDPTKVRPGSNEKKEWLCKKGHLFKQTVTNRVLQNQGCPYCSGKQVLSGFNDLQTFFPEVAKQANGWDPTTLTAGSSKKKAWRCQLGHQWDATVKNRTKQGSGCLFCSGNEVLAGFNDLQTLFPEVAKEADGWDPCTVTPGCSKIKQWKCKEGHKWKATPSNRTGNDSGCPDCAEFGFQPSKPAWFYLLARPGEQQLGLSNEPEVRLKTHGRNGWTEVEVVGPFAGELVLETEKRLKKWLRNEVGLVPGTHENWFTTALEVNSLAELKYRSGIETDLF